MAISFNNLRNINDADMGGVAYRVEGGVFTAISVSAGTLFSAAAVANDYFTFYIPNQCVKPRGMRFHVGTAWTAVGLTGVWEYRKADSTWAAFAGVVDATAGFTVAGTNLDVTWTVPTDWGTNATSVNGQTGKLWFRWRISAVTSHTVRPILGGTTPATTQVYDNAVRLESNHQFDSGTATSGAATTITDSGKAWTVGALRGRHIYIHTGTGADQHRIIMNNTATVITIVDAWTTNPDSTSQYRICGNFEDLYQADVSGGWGVITKAGQHSYAFNSFLDLRAGAFGDSQVNVEFQYDYAWYQQEVTSSAYRIFLGWRPPNIYGADKALFGCSFLYDKYSSVDERGSGAYKHSQYTYLYDNAFRQRFEHDFVGADGFLRRWFGNHGKASIGNTFEGWRSVTYAQTTPTATESVADTVKYGHSGIESPRASFKKLISYFNGSLALFQTNAVNYSFKDLYMGLNNYVQNSTRFTSFYQFFSYTGTTSKLINLLPRFRPMLDVFSTTSTGRSQKQSTIRVQLSDERGNPIQNGKVLITDTFEPNRFKVLNFDAVDDNVTIAHDANNNSFTGCTAYSVEAWVYTRSTGEGTFGRIFDKGSNTTTGGMLFNNAGTIAFRLHTSSGTFTSAGAGYANGSWYHFVGTFDGSNLRMYVNGNSTGSPTAVTGTINNDNAYSAIIGNDSGGTRTYDGFIRRVRIFRNKALSSPEIQSLYNEGNFTQNQTCPVTGCTGEYNFTDGSGTTVTDSSGNGNNGTVGGSAVWYDTHNGLTTQSYTLTTGATGDFLNGQTVTSGSSYSLSSQPASATRLRFTIKNFVDNSASGGNNARVNVQGTDEDGNAIEEVVWLEEFGNGQFYTENEFLTVNSSGLVTTGWTGTMTVDRAGLTYLQRVGTEQWSAPNDQNLLTGVLNPIRFRISAPGYEPVDVYRTIYKDQTLDFSLKRSVLDLT